MQFAAAVTGWNIRLEGSTGRGTLRKSGGGAGRSSQPISSPLSRPLSAAYLELRLILSSGYNPQAGGGAWTSGEKCTAAVWEDRELSRVGMSVTRHRSQRLKKAHLKRSQKETGHNW